MVEEIKQESLSIVEEAKQERAKIELLLEETKKLLQKNEEVEAKILLSGRAVAGVAPVVETEEQKLKREMKEIFKGTAVGDMIK